MQTILKQGKTKGLRLLFCTLLLLAIFQCHPRTVIRDGMEMPYEQAATLDFRQAEKAYARGKKQEAQQVLRRLIKEYPGSAWADDAESKLGDIYLADGNYREAELHYRSVAADYRFSPLKLRSTFRLGVCLYHQERFNETVETLSPITNRFADPVERLELYSFLTRSHEQLAQGTQALPFYVSMFFIYRSHELGEDLQTPFIKIESKEYIQERIVDIISQTDDKRILRRIISKYGNSFPAQHALLRLAQLQIEKNSRSLAESNLEELLLRFPNDPLAPDARILLKRIQSRYLVNESHIGVILPLSGTHARFGKETLQGIELAVALMADQFPQSPLKFFIKDSQSEPARAAKLVNNLVVDHQVIAIIGPLFSRTSMEAAREAEAMGVPMISLSSAEGIPELGEFIFRNNLIASTQAKRLVSFAMSLHSENNPNAGRFGILYPNHSYGLTMRDRFWDEVNEQKGQISAAEIYKPGQSDFKKEIQKLVGLYYREPRAQEWRDLKRQAEEERKKGRRIRTRDLQLPPQTDFSALFIPDYYRTAALIADYLPYFDIENVLLLGDSNWNHPSLLERNPRNLKGAVFTDAFFIDSERREVKAFVTNFRLAFEEDPRRHSAFAFDSTQILISLLQDPLYHSRETLRQGLIETENYAGATGLTTFQENGEVLKEPFLLQVQGKEIVEISNSEFSN